MELCEGVYSATKAFPKDETYGLIQQLRRAGVSMPSDIPEGQGRGGDKEFDRFLAIAHGSLRELETQIMLAGRLRYLNARSSAPLLALVEEIGRLINGLRRKRNVRGF